MWYLVYPYVFVYTTDILWETTEKRVGNTFSISIIHSFIHTFVPDSTHCIFIHINFGHGYCVKVVIDRSVPSKRVNAYRISGSIWLILHRWHKWERSIAIQWTINMKLSEWFIVFLNSIWFLRLELIESMEWMWFLWSHLSVTIMNWIFDFIQIMLNCMFMLSKSLFSVQRRHNFTLSNIMKCE